ncbi:hypothetical protein M0Q97_08790 [Candidatus Dojkabacteria bacterium]|jgi:hypothetical protein|nr:hypothetical protein [Candidatus Dojkabacteria bacterium]
MAKFVITGEMLTERIRDFWASKQYSKAIEYGLESIDGMTTDYLIEIIDGKKQLVGADLDFVDDDFEQEFKYIDIFKYADMNQNVYQRIYDEDMKKGLSIISHFVNYHTSCISFNNEKHLSLAYEWKQLLPDVRNTLVDDFNENGYPYWLSLYLRKSDKEEYRKIASKEAFDNSKLICDTAIENKTLLYQFYDEIHNDKEKFDTKCKELYIIDVNDEIWKSMSTLENRLKEPTESIKNSEEVLVMDIKMKSVNGWLSPDGTYYICEHGGHKVLSKYICEKYKYEIDENTKLQDSYSDVLLKKGWIQIHQPERWEKTQMTHCRKLTYDQEIKIERYESIHNKLKDNDVSFLLM